MPQKFKRRFYKYFPFFKLFLLVGIFICFLVFLYQLLVPFYRFAKVNNLNRQYFWNLVFSPELPLKTYQGKTNLVILGIPGGTYDGSDLTDTIIFLSLDYNKKKITMISLPRDIWLASLKAKINSAYHYGEAKQQGGGFVLARAAVEEIIGQPVHYTILIDFSGFEEIIDLVGGIDVYIEQAFTDEYYPITGKENDLCGGDKTFSCRYEKLHFSKGWQHMDGKTALKYVRSRQAEGDEGTDFARDKRQQQVILSLKDKVFQFSFFKNISLVRQLIYTVNEVVKTDMNWAEKIALGKFMSIIKQIRVNRLILDSFLVNPPTWEYKGLWVLVPKTGNFEEIKKHIAGQQ